MTPGGFSTTALEAVAGFLRERTGLHFPFERARDAEAGILATVSRGGLKDAAELLERLTAGQSPLDALVEELAVRETYFFREVAQFDFIRREVLPDLRSRRGEGRSPLAWSAGCASGEEAYSLAILLEEEGLAAGARILGTDICRSALAKARAAQYSRWSLRGAGEPFLHRFFARSGDRFLLSDGIRSRVDFEYLNLALDCYPSFAAGAWGMDLILCRNVLIYFDRETIARVARRLFETLAPGGWLVTGPSDPPLSREAPFETMVRPEGIFLRRPAPAAAATARMPDERLPVFEAAPAPALPAAPVDPAGKEPERPSAPLPLEQAEAAFLRGDYRRALELASALGADPSAAALAVKAAANLNGIPSAERLCRTAASRLPLSAELRLLHGTLLMGLRRDEEAARVLRGVLYLDRRLAVAHFMLGGLLRRRGDVAGARRAFGRARSLCSSRPGDEAVPLAEGERAGRLAEAAAAELELLAGAEEALR